MAGLLTDSSLQTPSHLFEAVAAFACPEFWKITAAGTVADVRGIPY